MSSARSIYDNMQEVDFAGLAPGDSDWFGLVQEAQAYGVRVFRHHSGVLFLDFPDPSIGVDGGRLTKQEDAELDRWSSFRVRFIAGLRRLGYTDLEW